LDDDEDGKSRLLTQEPVGPPLSGGWESDATDEEDNSFFDFGRGMNSLDSRDELLDE